MTATVATNPTDLSTLEAQRSVVRRARTPGRARTISVSVVLGVVTFAVFCVSISIGDFAIPLADVVPALFGHGNESSDFIIHRLRLPRALTAVLVGGSFGLSGAIFQTLARNPLASPDIIGITAGASTAAVAMIVLIGASGFAVSISALAGSLLTAAVIYGLAFKRGVSAYRLVLVGVGVAAVLTATTSYLLTRAEIFDVQRATVWLTGSLNGRGWGDVRPVAIAAVTLFPAAIALARPLRALQLGDDTATGLGVAVERNRASLILVAVALVGVATAAAGPVSFVALVSAPIARRLVKAPVTLVTAAMMGALLLLLSDLAARRVFAPTELPVGIVTGIVGAPYLVWLLARANKIGRGG